MINIKTRIVHRVQINSKIMQYKCIFLVSGLTSAQIHITSSCLKRVQSCGMCGINSFIKFRSVT
jgi:hypothetical protein